MAAIGKRTVRRRGGIPASIEFTNSVSFAIAAGASNVSEITVTPKNAKGTTIVGPRRYMVLLSDAATGIGLTATTASGAVTTKASTGGTDLGATTTKKAFMVQSTATGTFTVSITDSAKTTFYVVVIDEFGKHYVSRILATGDYGA